MLRSKSDVDAHVQATLHGLSDEEKISNGYRIGCLYFDIGQYQAATQHLQLYLSKNEDANASNLLNDCIKFNEIGNWEFWFDHISKLNDQLFHSLSNGLNQETLELLYEMDVSLNMVATKCCFVDQNTTLLHYTMMHFRGEFCFKVASLLFRLDGTSQNIVPLLLLAVESGPINVNVRWMSKMDEQNQNYFKLIQAQSVWRILQAVKILESGVSPNNHIWRNLKKISPNGMTIFCDRNEMLDEARSVIQDSNWKNKIYRHVFGERQIAATGSYWIESKEFGSKIASTTWQWPEVNEQKPHDLSILAHHVYLVIAQNFDPNFKLHFLKSTIDIESTANMAPDKADMYAFLFGCAFQAQSKLLNSSKNHKMKFVLLPYTNISNDMCTHEQSEIWKAAIEAMQSKSEHNALEGPATPLQYGIHAVRGIGSPKVDLLILLKIALTFFKTDLPIFQKRAEVLSKYALNVVKANHSISSFQPLFTYTATEANHTTEKFELVDEITTFLATRMFERAELNDLIDILAGIDLPYATYFTFECHRRLLGTTGTPKKKIPGLADKVTTNFKRTLELLEDKPHHSLNQLLQIAQSSSSDFGSNVVNNDAAYNVIGILTNDQMVIDSAGDTITCERYINKVTPLHQSEIGTARQLYETFTDDILDYNNDSEIDHNNPVNEFEFMATDCQHVNQSALQNETEQNIVETEQNMVETEQNMPITAAESSISLRPRRKTRVSKSTYVPQTEVISRKPIIEIPSNDADVGIECPIVGCTRIIKHFSKNNSRHIKEFHGEQLNDGKWVLKRYQCAECHKANKTKLVKRAENLSSHYGTVHPNKKPKSIVTLIHAEPPQYKDAV